MEVIYEKDWMQIFNNDEQYIIRYNSGDLMNSMRDISVTKADALKAQESDQMAYEIILKYQNLEQFPEG